MQFFLKLTTQVKSIAEKVINAVFKEPPLLLSQLSSKEMLI